MAAILFSDLFFVRPVPFSGSPTHSAARPVQRQHKLLTSGGPEVSQSNYLSAESTSSEPEALLWAGSTSNGTEVGRGTSGGLEVGLGHLLWARSGLVALPVGKKWARATSSRPEVLQCCHSSINIAAAASSHASCGMSRAAAAHSVQRRHIPCSGGTSQASAAQTINFRWAGSKPELLPFGRKHFQWARSTFSALEALPMGWKWAGAPPVVQKWAGAPPVAGSGPGVLPMGRKWDRATSERPEALQCCHSSINLAAAASSQDSGRMSRAEAEHPVQRWHDPCSGGTSRAAVALPMQQQHIPCSGGTCHEAAACPVQWQLVP